MPSTETSKIFADRLSDLLAEAKDKGLDYKKISKATGISTGALSNYASDKQQANLNSVRVLADYFDVSADYLLGRTADPEVHKSAADELKLTPSALQALKNLSKYETEYRIQGALNRMLSANGILELMVSIDRVTKIVQKEWLNATNYRAKSDEARELNLSAPAAMLLEEFENYYEARSQFKKCVPETRFFQIVNYREYAYLELELIVERFRRYLQEATGFRNLMTTLYENPDTYFPDTRFNFPIPNDSPFMTDYDMDE